MSEKLRLYSVTDDYVAYLFKFDRHVLSNKEDERTFALQPNTVYYVWARSAENGSNNNGPAQRSAIIMTARS